jgi:hypothetical protein
MWSSSSQDFDCLLQFDVETERFKPAWRRARNSARRIDVRKLCWLLRGMFEARNVRNSVVDNQYTKIKKLNDRVGQG